VDSVLLESTTVFAVLLPTFSNPLSVFAGGTATLTVQMEGPANEQVTFECTTVVDSKGTVRQATELGISCNSIPTPTTFSGGPQDVEIAIHTTGVSSASLGRRQPGEGLVYACLVPVVIGMLMGVKLRRTAWNPGTQFRVVAITALCVLTLLTLSCSSGGFSPPVLGQGATPADSYKVTIVDQPFSPTNVFVQTSLIVPLVVQGP